MAEKNNDKMAKMALEADGNIVGESFIMQPDKNLSGKLGILFGVIEIYNINDTFLDGFLGAISDLKTEYYLPPFNLERGVEKRFEEAISRANRRIFSAINQSVEEIDLRNVSAAIGLFHDNKVYLSSAGRMKGLFFRRKKNSELLIIDILSGNGDARFRPEPEKMFANILSGEMAKSDGVLLINEEYLAVFSQKELAETVLDNTAGEAIKILDDSLREKITKKNFYSVIIAPNIETEAAMSAKIEPNSELLLNQNVSTKPFRDNPASAIHVGQIKGKIATDAQPQPQARKTGPARNAIHNVAGGPTQQSIDRLLITQVRTEKYLTPSLLPQWQKILFVIWAGIKKGFIYSAAGIKKFFSAGIKIISNWNKKRSKSSSTIANEITALTTQETEDEIILDNDADPISMIDRDNQSENETASEPPEILMEEIAIVESKKPSGITEKINNFINGQIEKFLALKKGQQIMLAIGLILIFLFSQSVVMIGRASDKGQSSSSANDVISKQIEQQLNSAEALNIFNNETGALDAIKQARELLAQISDSRLNKSFKAELAAKIDKAAKALQKINFLDNPTVAANFSSSQSATEISGLARTGKIFWGFDNLSKTLYRLDPSTGKITFTTTSLPQIKQLAAIDDKNLILLADGKIYFKYDIVKNATAKTKPAKDYFQIKLTAKTSPLIDPPLASSTIAMSVTSESYSFYLDGINGRVVALDKSGILKRQYYSDKFKGATALVAAYKEKKLFVHSAGKTYQIDLDF
ncbi:MAG: hypothetical protein WCT26_04380 [Candidatus Buchananbacteria bacterium]|jgi:hypothetical protein